MILRRIGIRFAVRPDSWLRCGSALAAIAVVVASLTLAIITSASAVTGWSHAQHLTPAPGSGLGDRTFHARVDSYPYDGEAWTEVSVTDGVRSFGPPDGMGYLPKSGETLISPALEELLRRDPSAQKRIYGKIVGELPESVLDSPQQLVAFSVRAHLPGGYVAHGWGGPPDGGEAKLPLPGQALIAITLLGIPCVILFLVVIRLSAHERGVRTRRLSLLGLDASAVRVVIKWEGYTLAAGGSVIGLGVAGLISATLGRTGLLGQSWFSGAQLSTVLGAIFAAVVVVVVLGPAWAHSANTGPRGSRQWTTFAACAGAILPAVTVLGYLAMLTVLGTGAPQSSVINLVVLGCLLVCAACTFQLLPWLTRHVALRFIRPTTVPRLVSRARFAESRGRATGPAAGVFVCILAMISALGYSNFLNYAAHSGTPGQARTLEVAFPPHLQSTATHALLSQQRDDGFLEIPTQYNKHGGITGITVVGRCRAIGKRCRRRSAYEARSNLPQWCRIPRRSSTHC